LISQSAIQQFRESLRGQSFCPGEQGYDAARTVPNAMIDRRPAIIARCAGAADVIACVRFAREHDVGNERHQGQSCQADCARLFSCPYGAEATALRGNPYAMGAS
jgi:hypothetical protein